MNLNGGFLVTGAASGIGAAIALEIASPNTQLMLHTLSNITGLKDIVAQCEDKGAQVAIFQGDLSCAKQTQNLVNFTHKNLTQLNGVVSNAGFPDWRSFDNLPVNEFMTSVNLMQQSNFILLSQCANALSATQGSFIGVSSFLAHKMKVGENINPASACAKSGLEALLKSFAAQYASAGVRCNAIVPGYIKKNAPNHQPPSAETIAKITARIPAARLGLPAEVADLAYFLLSDKSRYITGQSIHIDGGLLLA
jgi:NAD(P)-dependent dehydrogenase (short-subunit alcohol dehydrogenase family)